MGCRHGPQRRDRIEFTRGLSPSPCGGVGLGEVTPVPALTRQGELPWRQESPTSRQRRR